MVKFRTKYRKNPEVRLEKREINNRSNEWAGYFFTTWKKEIPEGKVSLITRITFNNCITDEIDD